MLAKLRPRSVYDVLAAIGCFVALSTGGAYASHLVVDSSDVVDDSLTGVDVQGKPRTGTTAAVNGSLTTDDIAGQQAHNPTGTPFIDGTLTQWDVKNSSLVGGDLANNTVSGAKVTDNSLKGADIDEASLGQVPSAVLGGIGRWSGEGQCNPESFSFFVTCGVVTLNLPGASRVLVIGTLTASTDSAGDNATGSGTCRVATSLGSIPTSTVRPRVLRGPFAETEPVAVTAITEPLAAGSVAFGVECREDSDGLLFFDVNVSAVALSPN
jgi:hypothetical protein